MAAYADRPIVVAGEALIDLLAREDGSIEAVHGGGPFNTARTVARLGEPTVFLGMLSDDVFGRGLRASLVADGVYVDDALTTPLPTTLALAEIDAGGVASYRFYSEGTSAPALSTEHVSVIPGDPHSLHVGTLGLVFEPIASTLIATIEARKGTTLIALDPNCRPSAIPDLDRYREVVATAVRASDLVTLSDDDARVLHPDGDPREVARALLGDGPRLVVLTRGADGAEAFGHSWRFHVPAPRVEVNDTVGAGDAFAAALLAHLRREGRTAGALEERDVVEAAIEFAVSVSAVVCQRRGADPPFAQEIKAPPAR